MKKIILMTDLIAITGTALAQDSTEESSKVPLSARAGITLSQEQLESYEGLYELMPNFNLEFSVKKGKLMSQASGQEAHELIAKGDHTFVPTAFAATITFIANRDGEFKSLVLEQGGQRMTAPRLN